MAPGFTVVRRADEIEVRVASLPCGRGSGLVSWARRDDDTAVLMGSLHYRRDLVSRLTRPVRIADASDAELALTAYQDRGMSALEMLEGDFALVVWDARRGRLIGTRDPMGGYPLFWAAAPDGYVLSTEMRVITERQRSRRLDHEYFAEFLMASGPLQEVPGEATAYMGVSRVLPGTFVILERPGTKVVRRRYFDWSSRIVDPGTDIPEEMAEEYRPILIAAIRERIHGRTMSELSGGMDSTSISLLARDLVRSGTGEYPLHTLSMVYERLPLLARERPYIDAVLQRERDICAHRVMADEFLDFSAFGDPPPYDEPYGGLWRAGLDRSMLDIATEAGCRTILTGLGADEVHVFYPYHLADLLRGGRLLKAWREAGAWAEARNCGLWTILRRFGTGPLVSSCPLLWPFNGRTDRPLRRQTDVTVPPWIEPVFARRHDLRGRAIANLQKMYRECPGTALSRAVSEVRMRPGDTLRWAVAAPRGIRVAHPFLDPRSLTFGLGIQARLQPDPRYTKPVLAAMMRDALPQVILDRQRKGNTDEVYFLGLARHRRLLHQVVDDAPGDAREIFDLDVLLRTLQQAGSDGATAPQMQRLTCALSMISWLGVEETSPRASRSTKVCDSAAR